ncbi:MAG: RidA family protein [Gemmataceae bacterium]|nr:RidA family protein [Gemmataceae bacterium]
MSEITAPAAPKPVGLYPHARRAGDLLFLSGIGPRDPATDAIPADFREECRACFRNVRLVLEASGARWEDMVDVTVYLTRMAEDFAAYNEEYAAAFATARPARTTLGISALPTPIHIELKVVAVIGGAG